jgi:tRNA (guanine-N7-)-methyltransferase
MWVNQYIPLVKSRPDIILVGQDGGGLPQEAQSVLDAKLQEFNGQVVCELGSGSGGHLIALAKQNPQILHVGFELRFKRVFRTAEKALSSDCNNVLVLQADARQLSKIFKPASLNGIYINFPDPWNKRRWHKHRLLNEAFFSVASNLLKPQGFIFHKSDHLEYFLATKKLLESRAEYKIVNLTHDLHQSELAEGNILTEFEQLFCSQGLKINLLIAEKAI